MILKPTQENLQLAVDLLKQGDVIGMPTETVYGLAGSIDNQDALVKIFSVKDRPRFDPLIVHVPALFQDIETLTKFKLIDPSSLSDKSKVLIDKLLTAFWPGPFTIVLPKGPRISDLITSGLPTVALRMPKHTVAQSLIQLLGIPLAAPSANRFGRLSPTNAEHVHLELGKRIPFVLDGGACEVGLESTVVSLSSNDELTLLRPGGVPASEIEKIYGAPLTRLKKAILDPKIREAARSAGMSSPVITPGPKREDAKQPAQVSPGQVSPGMLASHYAPEKKLHLLPDVFSALTDSRLKMFFESEVSKNPHHLGVLLMGGDPAPVKARIESTLKCKSTVLSLSLKGDIKEAARNFFNTLRELDSCPADCLVAEPCQTEVGLAHAIADRLRRASA